MRDDGNQKKRSSRPRRYTAPPPPPSSEFPSAFGPYVLIAPLVDTRFGAAHMARGIRGAAADKVCVVTILRESLVADLSVRMDMKEEARHLVQLSYKRFGRVFDVGSVGKSLYVATELIEGPSLSQALEEMSRQQHQPDVATMLLLAHELLSALAWGHGRSDWTQRDAELIVRDLSPGGVVLSTYGDVKLVDFGLATSAVGRRRPVEALLQEYVAPEVLRGEGVDPRSDVFSVGLLLWECLAGRRLWPDFTARGPDSGVQLPDLREIRPELPEQAVAIVERATATARADRYVDAEAMRIHVAELLQELAPNAQPTLMVQLVETLYGDRMERNREALRALLSVDYPLAPDETPAESFYVDERAATAAASSAPLLPGEMLPGTSYRIVRRLGSGASGTVHVAEHVDIERTVALKVLHARLLQEEDTLERFRREARAASRIGHPGIVEVTDFGHAEDGRVYFCMEYLSGEPLSDVIATQGRLPVTRAVGIAHQLCSVLEAAHNVGIVHRDLKPDNVLLVEQDGRADFVKVFDFGIAKMTTRVPGERQLTKEDVIFGTPAYMAPEQAQGRAIDGRADVYALGVMMYEMLTGSVPFEGNDELDIISAQVLSKPQPLRQRVPEADIPAAFEKVVMRCLAKSPGDRPQSMSELDEELHQAQVDSGLTTQWDDVSDVARMARMPDVSTRPTVQGDLPAVPVPAQRGGVRRSWPLVVLGLLILAGASLWILGIGPFGEAGSSGEDAVPPDSVPVETGSAMALPSTPEPETAAPGDEELARALSRVEEAIRAGRLALPPGDNAMERLSAAREARPGEPRIDDLLMRAVSERLAEADRLAAADRLWALGRKDAARPLYGAVARLYPDNDIARERGDATGADLPAISRAASSALTDTELIALEWLAAQAELAILEERFIAPQGHNAHEYVLAAAILDPENEVVRLLVTRIAGDLDHAATDETRRDRNLLRAAAASLRGEPPPPPLPIFRDAGVDGG